MSILQLVRGNRQRTKSRSPLVNDAEERAANIVPFTPPIPQEITDEDVLAALGRIPVHYQEVIVLCDVEELSYKEIAAALSLPVGTVMSRLHRGLALLRRELAANSHVSRRRTTERWLKGRPIMQCGEVRELADSFLSEQLLVETNHEVLRHLESCPECRAELESRRTLRATIQRAFMNTGTLRMHDDFAGDVISNLRASGALAGSPRRGAEPRRLPL